MSNCILTVITYSYVFDIIACNDVLIMMHTFVYLLMSDVVVRQLCCVLTMMCTCCSSCDKKSCNQ
jgi:hypothetical protein